MAGMARLLIKRAFSPQMGVANRFVVNKVHRDLSEKVCVLYPKQHRLSHKSSKYSDIPSEISARNLILRLDDKGRDLLLKELIKTQENKLEITTNPTEDDIPRSELWKVFFFNGLPFIGFGLLDNMIMILAGEYIDVTLGAAFGISTMAAAALGNLISDVFGVASAGYVELLVGKIGVDPPNLTPAQALSWKNRWTSALGRAIGISVGCLIGMFPLLFIDSHKDSETTEEEPSAAIESQEINKTVVQVSETKEGTKS